MKRFLSKVTDAIFGYVFAVLLALFLALCAIVVLPLDYIKYKRSLYYKTKHEKYKLFGGMSIHFDIYNAILKNDLPIEYFSNPNDDSLGSGWFVFKHTRIIPNRILVTPSVFSFEYDSESGKWNYCEEDEEDGTEKRTIISLDEYLEMEVQDANEMAEQSICDKAVLLVDAKHIKNVEMAKQESRFLVYDGDIEEALKNLCK